MSYPETPEAAALALMREIMRRDPEDAKRTNLSQRTYILQLYAECYSVINGRFKEDVMDPALTLARIPTAPLGATGRGFLFAEFGKGCYRLSYAESENSCPDTTLYELALPIHQRFTTLL